MITSSVIICAWNPRQDFLQRTLDALARQSLPSQAWELVLVDNNSSPALAERGFSLPAHARIVREEKPGLTQARLRGIEETKGDLIVFVDDDNLLAPDYLEVARRIAEQHPCIGVFGGRSLPEFESPPPDWMKPFWPNLALHDFKGDRWTNRRDFDCFPCGAGMCLRREAAENWRRLTRENALSAALGRKGQSLASGEDTDIVLRSLDIGWGTGRFEALSLVHIIPEARLTLDYHCRLAYGMGISIGQINGRDPVRAPDSLVGVLRGIASVLRERGPARKVRWAAFRAYRKGLRQGWASRGAIHT